MSNTSTGPSVTTAMGIQLLQNITTVLIENNPLQNLSMHEFKSAGFSMQSPNATSPTTTHDMMMENMTSAGDFNNASMTYDNATTPLPEEQSIQLNMYSIIYICIGSCGILGNLFVVLTMLLSRELRSKMTNVLIINQSCIDTMASLVMVAHSTSQYYTAGYVGIWGLLRCKLWTNKWLMWHMFVTSTYNLVFLTLERYVHILYPFKYQVAFNGKIVALMILGAWAFPFSYKSPLFIHTTTVKNEICYVMTEWEHPAVQQFWGVLTALLQYFIPLGVMAFCYGRMIVFIRRRPALGSSNREDKMARASNNILKTLILVCAAFAACWVNNQVYFLMFNIGYPVDFNGTYFHFTVIMVFLNCCINPFIYCFKYHSFQEQVLKMYCGRKQVKSDGSDSRTRTMKASKSISGSMATLSSSVSVPNLGKY